MNKNINYDNKKIADHWSFVSKNHSKNKNLRLRWWDSPMIIKYINHLVCGEYVSGLSQGIINRVKQITPTSIPFKKGISVGGGAGQKEISLIKQGIVKSFDIYEISETRINDGLKSAKKNSLEKNINFISENPINNINETSKYDFIHWNNSLHHMPDVFEAVKWSKNILNENGIFFMDDFIGASRFQWPKEQLTIANKIRDIFKESKYLLNPKKNNAFLSTELKAVDINKIIATDPSEAADSENIIKAINKFFPDAEITRTGGIIYHLALSDMLHNFDEENDKILLDLLMFIDKLCIDLGQSHYATAIAFKKCNYKPSK